MSDYRKFERIGRTDGTLATAGHKGDVLDAFRGGGLASETYYGLREKPFALGSDPRFFYHSRPHASAHENLLASIRRRESLSVLSGEIGMGKTTLCRTVLQSLDRQTFSSFVPDPFASRADLLKIVLIDFGVISIDDLTSGRLSGATRTELSYLLYEFLRKLAPLQAFAVVVIDEAQNLSLPLLEEIRILSDSDGRERQLQVVLVGQPELQDKLRLHEMRQVEQRISTRCHLEPLTRDGVAGYVEHRLKVADGSPDRITFSHDGIDALHHASRGVPRLINRICDRALHHGHLRQAAAIDKTIVRQAVDDIGLNRVQTASAVTPQESVSAPAAPVSAPPMPTAKPPEEPKPDSHESVDVWLSAMEGQSSPVAALDSVPTKSRQHRGDDYATITLPQTYLQRIVRRSLRRAGTIVLWTMGLAMVGTMVTSAWSATQHRQLEGWDVPPALGAAPRPPQGPPLRAVAPTAQPDTPAQAGGGYLIHISLLSSERRAEQLVERLDLVGYPASRVPVGIDARTRHQVIAGPYATRANADAHLARLRESREFQDARIVELAPADR
jgi:type II secretory pathway predicted ATPase ExeA